MKVKKDLNSARATSKTLPLRIEFEYLKEATTDEEITKILLKYLQTNTEKLFEVSCGLNFSWRSPRQAVCQRKSLSRRNLSR
jgi:hypothetical protein